MTRPAKVVVSLVALVWTLPITGLALSAVQPASRAATAGWWTIATRPSLSLGNLRDVLAGSGPTPGMFESLVASLAVAVPATVLLVVLGTLAAYALAWIDVPGRHWWVAGALVLLFVPVQVTLVPLVAAYDSTGLRGTWPGLWLAHLAFGLPLAVVLLRGAMGQVPADLIDAARTDGAGHLHVLGRIVVPLVVPALVGVAALQFLVVWNDFVVAAALLGGPDAGTAPLPLALADLVRARPQEHHLLNAASLVTIVVPLVLYASLHRLVLSATRATVVR